MTVYNQKVFDDAVATYKDSGVSAFVDAAVDAQCRTNGFFAGASGYQMVNDAQPFNEDQESSASSGVQDMKDAALMQNYEQLTASLLNSGLYDSDDLLGAVRDSGKNRQTDRVVDEDGNPLTVGMDPSEIEDTGVKAGLDRVGGYLYHRADGTLDYTDTRYSSFKDGYEAAKPSNNAAPAHSWGG
mgnify:FL=1